MGRHPSELTLMPHRPLNGVLQQSLLALLVLLVLHPLVLLVLEVEVHVVLSLIKLLLRAVDGL